MPSHLRKEAKPGPASNPLRLWLMNQPVAVTHKTVSEDLGISRSYFTGLVRDRNPFMPSLEVAMRIENRTHGAVTAAELFDYVSAKRLA